MTEKDFFERFSYNPEKDLLGSGGFGSVYRAFDKYEKKYIAIKISQVKDIFGKFTLLNEVELSKKIDDHTNVARYEFGLRVMYPFPVDYAGMAYYEEGNLEMLLKKYFGRLTDKEYYEIVEGLLDGINHLHNENIIHRDLKLANILMHRTKQGNWRPKIADFGLSRETEVTDESISNSAIGITVAYAAPEQIENKPIKKNVDLWAFGVIVYRLFTSEMPFVAAKGSDPTSANLEIIRKIVDGVMPEKLNAIPEPYQTIIRRCWVKDTRLRAQSAVELLELLKTMAPRLGLATSSSHTVGTVSPVVTLPSKPDIQTSAPPSREKPAVPEPNESTKIVEESATVVQELPTLLAPPVKAAPAEKESLKKSEKENIPVPQIPLPVFTPPENPLPAPVPEAKKSVKPAAEKNRDAGKTSENTVIESPTQIQTTRVFESGAGTLIQSGPDTSKPLPVKSNKKYLVAAGVLALLLPLVYFFGIKKSVSTENVASPSPINITGTNTTPTTIPPDNKPDDHTSAVVQHAPVPKKNPVPATSGDTHQRATENVGPPPNITVSNTPTTTPPDNKPDHTSPVIQNPTDLQKNSVPATPEVTNQKPNENPKPAPPVTVPAPAAPKPNKPEILKKPKDIFDKLQCRGCCNGLSKGTITVSNFSIEASGAITVSDNTVVSISDNFGKSMDNSTCKEAILAAFKKNFSFMPRADKVDNFKYSFDY